MRPDSGQLAWFFQHVPGESLDLDEVFERVLVDVDGRKLSFNIGKAGILWKLDRQTGQFLDAKETVFQNVFLWKDKSQRPTGLSPRHSGTKDRLLGAVLPRHVGRQGLAGHEL